MRGRKVLQSMREKKCRSEGFLGRHVILGNSIRSEETADNPTGNTEHWFMGSCGKKFSELVKLTAPCDDVGDVA